MAVDVQTLYGHLRTLTKQWFYDKDEIDTALDLKADVSDIPDVSDVIRTSQTAGLVKNDGTIDTNVYLTQHQDISNYVQKSNTAGLIKNDGTIDTNVYLTQHQDISNYVQKSATAGLIKNDGTIDTNAYLTEHQDISGKANSADLADVATTGSYTDLEDIPETFAPSSHGHAASEITDANAYTNLQTSANSTQSAINYAIDAKIGALLSVELIEVAATRPTASASTMNKLYLVPESTSKTNDAYEIFVTVEDDGSYDWEKVDTARIDLSGKADIDHVHGNLTNDGKIGTNADYFVTTTTGGAVTSQEKIGNISTSGAIGTAADKVVVTTTSGVLTTSDMVTEMDTVINSLITYGNSL